MCAAKGPWLKAKGRVLHAGERESPRPVGDGSRRAPAAEDAYDGKKFVCLLAHVWPSPPV